MFQVCLLYIGGIRGVILFVAVFFLCSEKVQHATMEYGTVEFSIGTDGIAGHQKCDGGETFWFSGDEVYRNVNFA